MKTENKHQQIENILSLVRQGDQAAFVQLLSLYEPLVEAEVARYAVGLSHADREDLHQAALVSLYRAALKFDASQQVVEFGLFAKTCIANALISELRVLRRRGPDALSSEEPADSFVDDPAARLIEQEAFAALEARICALLSPFELRVWMLYLAGHRASEIARQLEKDTHSIENAVYRIRQKLRAELKSGD